MRTYLYGNVLAATAYMLMDGASLLLPFVAPAPQEVDARLEQVAKECELEGRKADTTGPAFESRDVQELPRRSST